MNTGILNKRMVRMCSILLAAMLILCCIGTDSASAKMSAKPKWTQVEQVDSSEKLTGEYFRVKTPLDEKGAVYVEGKSLLSSKRFCIRIGKHDGDNYATIFVTPNDEGEFSVKFNVKKGNQSDAVVLDGKGTVVKKDATWYSQPGYKAVGSMPAGVYHLTIARALTSADADVSPGVKWWNGSMGGSENGYANKEFVLQIKSGETNNPKLIISKNVISNNKEYRNLYEKKSYTDASYKGSYVRYQDKYLNDIVYFFKDPVTKKVPAMTSKKVNYIKSVADDLTSDSDSDYEKLRKFYAYQQESFYYDVLAEAKAKNQYADPYRNLYNQKNKVKSANSKDGKVATTCQGYASVIIALARAEGIPARMVYGQHIHQTDTIWSEKTLAKINDITHYWAEAYVDGRWVIVDANMGNLNKWKRSSFSAGGTWEKIGMITYAGFDPSQEALSNSYIYHGIYQGSNAGEYVCRATEVKQLKSFLNTKSNGMTNGKRLNSKYSVAKYHTWGNGEKENFETDGFGRVYRISWPKEKLGGILDLGDFSKLRYATLWGNNLKSIKVDNCSDLESLNASSNKITSFNGSTAKKLSRINLKHNKLTSAKFRHGGKTISIQRSGKGTFSFEYNKSKSKSLTIYAAKAPAGYKYKGIYTSSGKKLSGSMEYSFKPTAKTYYVKYVKK